MRHADDAAYTQDNRAEAHPAVTPEVALHSHPDADRQELHVASATDARSVSSLSSDNEAWGRFQKWVHTEDGWAEPDAASISDIALDADADADSDTYSTRPDAGFDTKKSRTIQTGTHAAWELGCTFAKTGERPEDNTEIRYCQLCNMWFRARIKCAIISESENISVMPRGDALHSLTSQIIQGTPSRHKHLLA